MNLVEGRGVRRQAGTAASFDRASRTTALLLVVASLLAACAARREASVVAAPRSSCIAPRGVESWTERRQPPVGVTGREGPAIVEFRVLDDSLGPNFPHRHAVVSLRSTDGGRWGQGQVDTTGYVWMSVAPGRYAAAVR